ncbi:MAG: WD40 repeat protein [Verrucomicrobiales bacterium]|jgi:WD40 repeat protein
MNAKLISILLLVAAGGLHAAELDYHADVQPILRQYCVGCHNEVDFDGDFSVETFRSLIEGGESGEVVKSGLLLKSLLKQDKLEMPPEKEPQPSAEQIAVLKAWIEAGANGPSAEADTSMLAKLTVPDIATKITANAPITAAEFSPDGAILAIARFAKVELLDAKTRKPVRVFAEHPGKINALHFSKDGQRLFTASGITGLRGVATIWNVKTGEKIAEFGEGHTDILFDAKISPTDQQLLATAGYDRAIRLWNLETRKLVRKISGHNGAVFDLAFSPDGKILASASGDETIKLWKVETGERLDTLNQPQGEQFAVAFTPDGAQILGAGADNRIRLWKLVSRDKPQINPLIHARFAHEDDIVALAVSRDGKRVVSAAADLNLKSWTLPGLEPLEIFGEQPELTSALSFSSADRFVATRLDGSFEEFQLKTTAAATVAANSHKSGGAVQSDRPLAKVAEIEPNNRASEATELSVLPAEVSGKIGADGDTDAFWFRAKAGEEWVVEINAARNKSKLDSKVEIFDSSSEPVERVVLQAVRDSWFTFRGKDSNTSDDFRVHNWREMELNQLLYANGEVVKLFHYPRGPDSGFKVYPGFGNRETLFDTTPLSHPLGEPCYIVRALPPGTEPSPNGLPVYRLFYENDDDSSRRMGKDSKLHFTAPADGDFVVRIRDVRGFGGEEFGYAMTVRPRRPDFKITIGGQNAKVSPGSGKEFELKVERMDNFKGEIRVDITGLPSGFTASSPIVIEAGQARAYGVINAGHDAPAPAAAESKLKATATIRGKSVTREIGSLGKIELGEPAKVAVQILPDGKSGNVVNEPGKPLEFTIAPGETITARVKAARIDFKERIELGKDDAGRNLPHGVYVDNIGLNGLLIVEGQDERQFFITAAPWVPDTTRIFHIKTGAAGGHATLPAILHVRSGKVTRAGEE